MVMDRIEVSVHSCAIFGSGGVRLDLKETPLRARGHAGDHDDDDA